jgi:hypothetical protein
MISLVKRESFIFIFFIFIFNNSLKWNTSVNRERSHILVNPFPLFFSVCVSTAKQINLKKKPHFNLFPFYPQPFNIKNKRQWE